MFDFSLALITCGYLQTLSQVQGNCSSIKLLKCVEIFKQLKNKQALKLKHKDFMHVTKVPYKQIILGEIELIWPF